MNQPSPSVASPKREFAIHTLESVGEASRPVLERLHQAFGFIPNGAATMAGSPALLQAFAGAFTSFHGTGLDEREKQVVLLTNAVTLRCPWTVAFHSTLALRAGVAAGDVAAIRRGRTPEDPRHAALSGAAKALIEKHGHLDDRDVERFVAGGYPAARLLDVITGIGLSTMAALTTSMARTPVEDRFQAHLWSPSSA